MPDRLLLRATLMLAGFLAVVIPCRALGGRVVDVGTGLGIGEVAVTLNRPANAPGPDTVTVFTDAHGRYAFPMLSGPPSPGSTLTTYKLGYRVPADAADAGAADTDATLFLAAASDIAAQVPASAWLGAMPAGDARNIVVTSCASCHQVPSPRMRDFAAQIEAVRGGPDGDAKALAAWRKVVRHEAWRAMVKYMRTRHYAIFPDESAMNLDAVDWPTALNPDYNFFTARQGELVAQFLAEHFPRTTATLPSDGYAYGAPLGVTPTTVIREYAFPPTALVRELVPAPGSPYLWGADVQRSLLVRLDPVSGDMHWYPVSFEGSTGPHTIAPDDAGKLWVSMVDNGQFGRFDPDTERWALWTLRPSNLPPSASLATAALVHDMSIDERGHVARDRQGRIWLTLVGSNQLGTIVPDTGEVAFHAVSRRAGLSAINHLIYSTVLSPDGRCAWYSQVNGDVGCLDTASATLAKTIEFPAGSGPRRMTRDDTGHLWVALFGSGQITRIDMQQGERTATYDLPDRAAAPYAVVWDDTRGVLWVVTANADAIYRFDPAHGDFTVVPLPRRMAYLRQLGIDHASGRLIGTYANYPVGSGPAYAVVIDVGDR